MHVLKRVSDKSVYMFFDVPFDHFSTKTAFGVILIQQGHLNRHLLWGKIEELVTNQFLREFFSLYFSIYDNMSSA